MPGSAGPDERFPAGRWAFCVPSAGQTVVPPRHRHTSPLSPGHHLSGAAWRRLAPNGATVAPRRCYGDVILSGGRCRAVVVAAVVQVLTAVPFVLGAVVVAGFGARAQRAAEVVR